ncbi:MAG: hypothetical protein HYR96_16000 [Deltaproteobacteria bacterium]|nr:hypothetical protein [Deltaproteobacteria bacterium]MBI3293604.1 hypothetical protein [Deltaproteobacteria bacterium]
MLLLFTLCVFMNASPMPISKTENGFLIKTVLSYTSSSGVIESEREFILPKNNTSWNTLVDPKNGVALIGRLVKSDKKSIHIEYMILDTKKANAIISTPSIAALLGESAEIGTQTDTEQISIKFLASRTEYKSDK